MDYTHECPNCGSEYCGEIDSDSNVDEKDFQCEDCGENYHIFAEIEISVTVT